MKEVYIGVPVPVPAPLLRTVIDYRRGLDLPSDYPLPDETTPLVLSVNGTQGIGYSQLLKALFSEAANRLEASEGAIPSPESVADIAALRRATPHWFRHTYATDLFDAAVDPRIVKENLGHASMDTTLIYSHTEDRARHEQTQRLAPHPSDTAGDEPGSA